MIDEKEASLIAERIAPIFEKVSKQYDFTKYPAQLYEESRSLFETLGAEDTHIENAMIWKWGHGKKDNFPQRHKALITEIQKNWKAFCESTSPKSPEDTFNWWKKRLDRNTTYITVAFITHLVHYQAPLPIIDQHNFRGMNHLIQCVRPGFHIKKKPSNWRDIQDLKSFMLSLCTAIEGLEFSRLDRFLMMYGRNVAPR
ncbi:MAG TPA: hypothetical protein DIT18_00020 [Pseudomonas sp.]|nr:hypothetical protein [Pseudomonas sp.]